MLQVLLGGGGFFGVNVIDHGAPAGFVQALDFQGAGVTVAVAGGTATITIPGGGGGGPTVQDVFGNVVAGATLLSLQAPMVVNAGAPGEAIIYPFTAATPAEDTFAVYATAPAGDFSYASGLRFPSGPGRPRFYEPGRGWALDDSVGYAVLGFQPATAPGGPPWFGAGSGVQLLGQHAQPGSGLSGGDCGVQGGNSDTGAIGGTAFVQPGSSTVPADNGESQLRNAAGAARVSAGGAADGVGFHGTSPIAKPTVLGSRGGNAALTSLLSALASYGLIIDGTTP